MNNEENLFLGVFEIQDAKRIQAQLKENTVEIFLKHNGETCGTGSCSVRVEMWGLSQDQKQIIQFFKDENERNYAGLDVNPELFNSVFDPTQEKVKCQACGFDFKPTEAECPDCGLSYR